MHAFDPEALAEQAKTSFILRSRQLHLIKYDLPPVSLRNAIVAVLFVVAAGWAYSWWVHSARDAWWRSRIAESSAVVDAIVAKGKTVATATDAEIIEGLKDADKTITAAERRLADLSERKPGASRSLCTVPASCLRE